jgi:DNA-binding beta-propeller fold protein YncE
MSGALAALLIAVWLAPSAGAATTLTLTPIRQIGAPGHADVYPWGLATTLDGKILMTDYWNWRIVQFNADGSFDRQLVGPNFSGPAAHQAPYSVAVDPRNGDFYFGDVDAGGTVDKYSATGTFLYSVGGPSQGSGVNRYVYPAYPAVSSTGKLIVADSRDNNLVMVSATGTELFTFGTTSPGRVQTPRGIAVCHHCDSTTSDLLFVAEAGGRRVDTYRVQDAGTTISSVSFIRSFGSSGTGPGQFGGDMRGVAVDEANRWVYIVDAATGFVSKFTTTGTYLLRFGGKGSTPGKFVGGGRGVTVDLDGNVWVADMPDFKAQKFSPTGQFLLATPTNGPPDGGFNASAGVAVDASGNVFVADQRNWRIQKFNADGSFALEWGDRGGGSQGFNYARGVAVDRSTGAVVVADTDNTKIKKYSNNGTFLWQANGKAFQVDVGADGRIYFADFSTRRVNILSSSGALLSSFSNGSGPAFSQPRGISVDPVDNSIWIADAGRVRHYSNGGTYLGSIGTPGNGTANLGQVGDVETDADFVYVADSGHNMIKVWRKGGTFVGAFGGSGTALGRFNFPWGMDLSPSGTSLYVVEMNGERVQELAVLAS